ncbi:MAG: glycosyltransferase [Eubacteriales bacterium]|nr:glycosyltransferase [Eubacteriales bacterium]
MPKVSIIIPTFNVEAYLVECMNSIVRQTLQDIEIICVNDGSTDSSLEILKSYAEKDSRIVLIDKENGGYGMAMNRGLDKATGEYIGILEPDDYVPLQMYEDLYEVAVKNQLDFVKADFYRFVRKPNGDMNLKYFHLSDNPEDYNKVFNPSMEPKHLNYVMNTWSGIYRREFLEENKIRHHETPGASFQDNGFFFQTFVYAKRAMIIDKPYYRNRRDNPNSSVHNPGKVYCVNQEYDYIREILMDDPAIWNRFKYMYWKKRFTNYLATIDRIGNEYKTEYTTFISKELNKASEAGLIRKQEYNDYHWGLMQFILKDPQGYVYTKLGVPKTGGSGNADALV